MATITNALDEHGLETLVDNMKYSMGGVDIPVYFKDGKPIACENIEVVESYNFTTGDSYIKYKSGLTFQWGDFTIESGVTQYTKTLPLSYKSQWGYRVGIIQSGAGTTSDQIAEWNNSTSQFIVYRNDTMSQVYSWMAVGYT